jgi:hypothetical protein
MPISARMGRLFGLIAMLMGIWAAAEVYTKGFASAFGGALAGFDDPVVPLNELHSNGGRGRGAPRAARDDNSDITVTEDPDPFAPKPTPIQRLGAHVQGEIDSSYDERYGNQ